MPNLRFFRPGHPSSICTDLVDRAVTLKACEHNFCQSCIYAVVANGGELRCPDCRTEFTSHGDIVQPFRIMRQVLASIKINCSHDGCKEEVEYEQYQSHVDQCQFSPNAITTCSYCDTDYARKDENIHRDNCTNYLKFQKLEFEKYYVYYVSKIPKDGELFPFVKESVRTNIIYIIY